MTRETTGGRIKRLDEAVANQIAAGEVVERPASVVKELVENALDAQATRIRVEVEEGGTRRIKITDDGYGMGREDAVLCLERHATSKIQRVEDLDAVRTLGFRGEAVPSIASVSRFTLTTREPTSDVGTRVTVEGGRDLQVADVGAPPGTTVEVADLFYNVPARKKFLKRPGTELSHVSEQLVRLAMCRPEVGFKLVTEHKTLLDVPPASAHDPKGRLARILGADVAARLHAIPDDGRAYAVQVQGFVAEPGLSERGTKGLYTFVNGRFVRDRTIQHAVQDAYRTLLERGRYPVVVLFIELDPAGFDVNVHPQKTEVRFARTGDIHRAVAGAVSRGLEAQPWLQRGGAPEAWAPSPAAIPEPRSGDPARARTSPSAWVGRTGAGRYVPELDLAQLIGGAGPGRGASSGPTALPSSGFGRGGPGAAEPTSGPWSSTGAAPAEWPASGFADVLGEAPQPYRATPDATPRERMRFADLTPIGQVLGTYLVCQAPDRLVLIDQHAAHERVTFQRLRTQRRADALEVQPLLIPLVLELDARRDNLAQDMASGLADVGITLEPDGEGRWLVKTCPAALRDAPLERMVLDLLDELAELPESTAMEDYLDALFSCAACHTAVRAQDRLQVEEIRALLQQMDEIDFGAYCPHGRPVFVEWSAAQLARLFHRS